MTGTVEARKENGLVTLTLRLTPADFIDVAAGLMAIDILGGFSAWRTVLPLADAPARYAGQFHLKRYAERTEGTPDAGATPATGETPTADTGSTRISGITAGCRDCGQERAREGPAEPVAPAAPAVAEREGAGAAVVACEHPLRSVRVIGEHKPHYRVVQCDLCAMIGTEYSGQFAWVAQGYPNA